MNQMLGLDNKSDMNNNKNNQVTPGQGVGVKSGGAAETDSHAAGLSPGTARQKPFACAGSVTRIISAITACFLTFAGLNSNAQTNAPSTNAPASATGIQDVFLGDVQSFFTSFSTNTWAGTKGYLETGAAYQKNVNFANTMELGVDVKDISPTLSLYAGAKALNALGLGGVVSSEVQAKLAYRLHDVQAYMGLGGGYNFQAKDGEGSLSLGLMKLMTTATFVDVALEPTLIGKSVKDFLMFKVGFRF